MIYGSSHYSCAVILTILDIRAVEQQVKTVCDFHVDKIARFTGAFLGMLGEAEEEQNPIRAPFYYVKVLSFPTSLSLDGLLALPPLLEI